MKLTVLFLLVLSLISCAGSSSKVVYKTSRSLPTLEIPPDLTNLEDSDNLAVPNSLLGTKAVTGRYKDTGPLLDRVLPKIEGVELKGSGDYHWLEIQSDSAEVYDLLKTFWAEEGFVLEQDEPLIGLMKTEWLENKAGILFESDSFFARLLESISSSDSRDQYTSRVERGDNANSTNVYITQAGQEFFILDSDEDVIGRKKGWQSRPNEPELETEMLSRFMIFLGLENEIVRAQLAKIGKFPKRARLSREDKDSTLTLIVKESLDRTWNRTLLNLNRSTDSGLSIVEMNKAKGIIRLRSIQQKAQKEEQGFFAKLLGSSEKESEQNVINLNIYFSETVSQATEIRMFNDDTNEDDISEPAIAMLQYLYERLK